MTMVNEQALKQTEQEFMENFKAEAERRGLSMMVPEKKATLMLIAVRAVFSNAINNISEERDALVRLTSAKRCYETIFAMLTDLAEEVSELCVDALQTELANKGIVLTKKELEESGASVNTIKGFACVGYKEPEKGKRGTL